MTETATRRRIDMATEAVPILVIARNERNLELLGQLLRIAGYAPVTGRSLDTIDRVLDQDDGPVLAVLDAEGFDAEFWDSCKTLRAVGTPFLVLSVNGSMFETDGLRHGARIVLEKPIGKRKLLEMIEVTLRDE